MYAVCIYTRTLWKAGGSEVAASRSSGVVEGSKSGVNVGSEGKAGGTVFLDLRLGNWRGGSWGKKGMGWW